MELSERCIQTLEKEGFTTIYEDSESPNTTYETHTHEYKVAVFVTEGSLEITVNDVVKILQAGGRADIPANAPHSTIAGPEGCQLVMGEK